MSFLCFCVVPISLRVPIISVLPAGLTTLCSVFFLSSGLLDVVLDQRACAPLPSSYEWEGDLHRICDIKDAEDRASERLEGRVSRPLCIRSPGDTPPMELQVGIGPRPQSRGAHRRSACRSEGTLRLVVTRHLLFVVFFQCFVTFVCKDASGEGSAQFEESSPLVDPTCRSS